ncbi:LysR family transcriptional regulator [Pseudosulfitobacter sp. SM2401]|uniref:LysR family transcriptional regulator n=1 Tax=Pseudosulfitobacter sp. SM2401 TaxID=3350098 RepID=UPI0036F23EAE
MKNWDDLRFCLALERYATMTAAAEHLGTNTATVSRRIERITEELGQPLFTKDGQSWQPTSLATKLISIAAQTEAFLTSAQSEENTSSKHSDIRINAPLRILQSYLAPIIGEVSNGLENVTLVVSLYQASLAFGETDIVLSEHEPNEGRLIRKRLGTTQWRSYCDINHFDNLQGWGDLAHHEDVSNGQDTLRAHFDAPPVLKMEGLNLMRTVMRTAAIVCRLPKLFAQEHHDLIEVPIGVPTTSEVWLSYHYTRRSDTVIRDIVDILSNIKQ